MNYKCNEHDGSNNKDSYSCISSKNDRNLIDETRNDFYYNLKQAPDDIAYHYSIRCISFSQFNKSGDYMKIISPLYIHDTYLPRV